MINQMIHHGWKYVSPGGSTLDRKAATGFQVHPANPPARY
jgi:hypothetical protein